MTESEQDLWAGATIDERWYITRQPEQEPCCYGGIAHDCHAGKGCRIAERIKVTQKPPQRTWVGLTDEEVDECYYWKDRLWTTDELVRHVEAKLKEKNT